MPAIFRNYNPEPRFGADYHALRDFLLKLRNHNYLFGRWDWMITHSHLDEGSLPRIGLWEENGALVAVATYDCSLGKTFLLALKGYEPLKEEMLLYARERLQQRQGGGLQVVIQDGDAYMQSIAARHGFYPTQKSEMDSVYEIGQGGTVYKLPSGFRVTSMAETYDLYQYGQVLWRGFNHEQNGEGPFVFKAEELPRWELEFKRPNVNLSLKVAVVAPNGDFVSYCGMWYDSRSEEALVEPVATDPAYRRMGLGRAAVLEGVRRGADLGAKRAFVGSSQPFHYSIGFRPYATSTCWALKEGT